MTRKTSHSVVPEPERTTVTPAATTTTPTPDPFVHAPHLRVFFEQIARDGGHPNPALRAREVMMAVSSHEPSAATAERVVQLLRDFR